MTTRLLLSVTTAVMVLFCVTGNAHAQSSVISHFNQSLEYEGHGKMADALSEMETAAAAPEAKDDYLVTVRLGWLNFLNRNYEASVKYYQEASGLAKQRSIEALLGLTLPLAAKQDWTAVESAYLKILAIDPGNYTANLKLGQIYLSRADYADAKKYVGKALENFPGEYEANLSFGWTAFYLGQKDQARTCFEHALMLSPLDSSATNGLEHLK
jgi:tetratricopeptide (TPR) repeat protein